jgi:hypothetical protein
LLDKNKSCAVPFSPPVFSKWVVQFLNATWIHSRLVVVYFFQWSLKGQWTFITLPKTERERERTMAARRRKVSAA